MTNISQHAKYKARHHDLAQAPFDNFAKKKQTLAALIAIALGTGVTQYAVAKAHIDEGTASKPATGISISSKNPDGTAPNPATTHQKTSIAIGNNAVAVSNTVNNMPSGAHYVSNRNPTPPSEAQNGFGVVIGSNATTKLNYDVAIGGYTSIEGFHRRTPFTSSTSTTIHDLSKGSEHIAKVKDMDVGAVAIGFGATSIGAHGDTIIGAMSTNKLNQSYIIKPDASCEQNPKTDACRKAFQTYPAQATAIGSRTLVYGDQALAIGADTIAGGHSSIAIGGDDIEKARKALSQAVDIKFQNNKSPVEGIKAHLSDERLKALINTDVIFPNTISAGDASIAIGPVSQSLGVASVAVGTNALTYGDTSISIGALSRAGNAFNVNAGRDNAIAIGSRAEAREEKTVAIGFNNNVFATSSSAIGNNIKVSAGNSDVSNIVTTVTTVKDGKTNKTDTITTENKTDAAEDSQVLGNNVVALVGNSVYLGSGSTISTDNETKRNATTQSITSTTKSSAPTTETIEERDPNTGELIKTTTITTTKFTTKTTVHNELGATTTGGAKGEVNDATVGNFTYGGFAGPEAIGAVTVGAAGKERRIQNVAAGQISATSTDAINGSQLFAVAEKIAYDMPVIYTDDKGNKLIKSKNGNFYPVGTALDENGNPVDNKIQPVTKIIASMNDGDNKADTPKQLSNVSGNLTPTYNVGDQNIGNDGKPTTDPTDTASSATPSASFPTNIKPADIYNNAATVGDILNAGWNLQGDSEAVDFVKPYDTVNFVKGNGTTVSVTTDTNGKVNTVKYDIEYDTDDFTLVGNKLTLVSKPNQGGNPPAPAAAPVNEMPVIYADANGNKVIKSSNGNFYPADKALKPDGTPVDPSVQPVAKPIALMNDGDNKADTPQTLGNIFGNLTPTYNKGDQNIGNDGKPLAATAANPTATKATTKQDYPSNVGNIYNNAATVGDVLNAGWNLQGDGKAVDFVKPYDTVNFVKGNGTTVSVTTDANGKVNTVKYDIAVDGKTIVLNKDGTLSATAVNGAYPDTTHLTLADGKVENPDKPNAFATAQDVANAINNSGFNITGAGNGSGHANQFVSAGAKVTFNAGDNLVLDQSGATLKLATARDVNFDSVSVGQVKIDNAGINAGGLTVSNVGSGLKDAQGNPVTNLSQAVQSNAVNVGDLQQALGNINANANNAINDVDARARGGIASAMASAGLPQVYMPGKSMVAVGVGHYRGENALAIGASTISDNGKWIIKGTVNANRKDVGGSIGVGYQW